MLSLFESIANGATRRCLGWEEMMVMNFHGDLVYIINICTYIYRNKHQQNVDIPCMDPIENIEM